MSITLKEACAVIDAALAKSTELGVAMDIAVVDAGANLKTFARMDGAWVGSIYGALEKARTACFFDMRAGSAGEQPQTGGAFHDIQHGGTITRPGVPLRNGAGEIIGAIGVSGGTEYDDHAVAEAGAVEVD